MLLVDAATVRRLLTPQAAVEAVDLAFRAAAQGSVVQPQRLVMAHGDGRALATMPALVEGLGLGTKVVTISPDNPRRGAPVHSILVLLMDLEDGSPLALVEGSRITALRTAAGSALATDALALPEASTLAVLGAGVQARAHVECLVRTRPIRRLRLWSRRRESAEVFAQEVRATTDLEVSVLDDPDETAAQADVVCTTTASPTPVLDVSGLRPGAHVNAVGASFASLCELTPAAVAACAVYVDSVEAARAEAGDLLNAAAHGCFDLAHVRGELGEVLVGRCPGRQGTAEITLFKSVGLAAQDVAVASLVVEAARAEGLGLEVSVGAHA